MSTLHWFFVNIWLPGTVKVNNLYIYIWVKSNVQQPGSQNAKIHILRANCVHLSDHNAWLRITLISSYKLIFYSNFFNLKHKTKVIEKFHCFDNFSIL